MKKNYNLEFWNLVCHFGEQKLLDRYIDFVHPAFTNKHERARGQTRYMFYGAKLIVQEVDGEQLPFIFGRHVKDTVFEREQVMVGEDLVEEPLAVPNAPSSIFILSLKDHRLFYIKEQVDSPTADSFKTTLEYFIKKERTNFINSIYEAEQEMRRERGGNYKSSKKKDLEVTFPEPDINLVPLSSDADIEQFIKSMKLIKKFSLTLVKPNDEADMNPFFKEWRKVNGKMNQPKSKVDFSPSGKKKTLPHDDVAELSKEVVKDGNIILKLNGTDMKDDKLNGTEEDFKLTKVMDEINEAPTILVKEVYESFKSLIADGIVTAPRITNLKAVTDKLKYIISMIK
ncbi:hypothetical protein KW539_19790 [Vibrio fluvialis]|nr:hypothetical protein [Vibrio fluvialis]MBY8242241.1 hypothetical protein [Vibrio fluvialis]